MSAEDETEDGELPEEGEISDTEDQLPPPPVMPILQAPPPQPVLEYNDVQLMHQSRMEQNKIREQIQAAATGRKAKGYRDYDPKEQAHDQSNDEMMNSWMTGVQKAKSVVTDTHNGDVAPTRSSMDANAEYYGYTPSTSEQSVHEILAGGSHTGDVDYRYSTSNAQSQSNEFGDRDYRGERPSSAGKNRKRRHSGESDGAVSNDLDNDYRKRNRGEFSPPNDSGMSSTNDQDQRQGQYPPPRIFRGGKRPTERLLCKFYREGFCRDAENCTYSHSIGDGHRASELCKFYQQGFCKKNWNCPFLHGEWPCKQFHRDGSCTRDHCKFSHCALDEFSKAIFDLQLARDEEFRRVRANQQAGLPNGGPSVVAPNTTTDEMETLPSKRTVLLNTPISQRGEMNLIEFLNWFTNGQLLWNNQPSVATTVTAPIIPPTGYPPGMAPPTSAVSTSDNYIPVQASTAASVSTITPSQQGPLLATPSNTLLPTPSPLLPSGPTSAATLPQYMQAQIQHPPPPPPSGMPPVPVNMAAIPHVLSNGPQLVVPPVGLIAPTSLGSSVPPGPTGTTYDQSAQSTSAALLPTATYPTRTPRQGNNMGLPATIGMGLLPVPTSTQPTSVLSRDSVSMSISNEAVKREVVQSDIHNLDSPDISKVKEEVKPEAAEPAPAVSSSGPTFDINEMLRRIRQQQVKEEKEEPPEESPASPPPAVTEQAAKSKMPVTIPAQDMPKYKLVIVDVAVRKPDAELMNAALTDNKLRNDPRIKKLLDNQFNAVTNLISSASQQSSDQSESSIPSIVQNPYKPIDPRSVASRDPRSRAMAAAASSTREKNDTLPPAIYPAPLKSQQQQSMPTPPVPPPQQSGGAGGWMPSLAQQSAVDNTTGHTNNSAPSYMPPMPTLPPPDLNSSPKMDSVQKDPRLARYARQQRDNPAPNVHNSPKDNAESKTPLTLREKRADLLYESPLGARGNRYNQGSGLKVVKKRTGTSPQHTS